MLEMSNSVFSGKKNKKNIINLPLTLVLLIPDMPCLLFANSAVPDQLASEEAN